MTTFVPSPPSISSIVISVGSIILSVMIASLFVSYNPTGLNFTLSGYFKVPSLDSMNGNRTRVEISEQGQGIVKDDKFSSPADVPAFAPTMSVDEMPSALSVDELQEVENSNDSVSGNGHDGKDPNVLFSSVFIDDSGKNGSGVDGYAWAEVPALASPLSTDVMPPTLFVDELQEVENVNNTILVNGHDSTEPDVSVSSVSIGDSGKNSSEIVGDNVTSLNQTVSVAAVPSPPSKDYDKSRLRSCDLYHGKWIYDPAGPLYTNSTCPILAQPQNCQGNGRPDRDYENWRWKPYKCDIPRFHARKFLELMRGKTLAFVGDSLARNQMESLLCILWQTEVPIKHGNRQMHKWYFKSTSTTIVRIWSAWLVHKTTQPLPSASPRAVNVHLDIPDYAFMQFLFKFDAVVLSSGHWFTAESTYLLRGTIISGQPKRTKKSRRKKTGIIKFYSMALQTTLNAIANLPNYTGLTILRSYSPEHYEGGGWNSGGSCAGIDRPSSKLVRSGYTDAMQKQQVAEFGRAAKKLRNGSKLRFMDITEMSGYRHDGHASLYSRKVRGKNVPEDCVHWCMPGIADTWNELLFEILKREL